MSSMYHVLHGIDPIAPLLLRILDLGFDLPRFRDIHLSGDGTRIMILTRTGGLNRQEPAYREFHQRIRKHPNFLSDVDDAFDDSFAILWFSVPEWALVFTKLEATGVEPLTLKEKTEKLVADPGLMQRLFRIADGKREDVK